MMGQLDGVNVGGSEDVVPLRESPADVPEAPGGFLGVRVRTVAEATDGTHHLRLALYRFHDGSVSTYRAPGPERLRRRSLADRRSRGARGRGQEDGMMSARERAIDIVWRFHGRAYTKPLFRLVLEDTGEAGETIRKLVNAVQEGIEEDRRAMQKAQAPS